MKKKLFWTVYPYYFIIIIGSLVAVALIAASKINNLYLDSISSTLETRANLVSHRIQDEERLHQDYNLDSLVKVLGKISQTRITIMSNNGFILADSEKDPKQMENHGNRPEVTIAKTGLVGQEIRYSSTVNTNMMYVAVQSKNNSNTIVRTALPMNKVQSALHSFNRNMIISGIVITIIATFLSLILFRRISLPLKILTEGAERYSKGDFSTKIPPFEVDEIGTLADSMNHMATQLDSRFATIVQQKNERDAILSSLAEGVLALDTKEKIVSLNKKALELLELDNTDVIGKSIQEVVRNKNLHDIINELLHNKTKVQGEIHFQMGADRYLAVYGTILRDEKDNQIGTVLVLNDITKIKRLDIIRRDFVANVSHELRTPITAIEGSVETLLEGALDDPHSAKKFTEIIARHSNRLTTIVEDLLALAKVEDETEFKNIKFEEENIYQIIESALLACEQMLNSKSITNQINCSKDLSAKVNRQYLEHALSNLLANAVKYSDQNSTITISGQKVDNTLHIAVTDQGDGIDAHHLPRLFERFYRVDMARSREMGGTGLGLAIVKHIARAHNGIVDVVSEINKGSTFTIKIPLS